MNNRKCWKTTKKKVHVSKKTTKNYKNGDNKTSKTQHGCTEIQ